MDEMSDVLSEKYFVYTATDERVAGFEKEKFIEDYSTLYINRFESQAFLASPKKRDGKTVHIVRLFINKSDAQKYVSEMNISKTSVAKINVNEFLETVKKSDDIQFEVGVYWKPDKTFQRFATIHAQAPWTN